MKKKMFVLSGMVLALLSLSACGSSNNDGSNEAGGKTEEGKTKITFNWWGSEVRHERYIKAIELFESENPDIDVEYEYSAWDDYWKKLATKSAAGELPDIMQMDAQYLAQYGEKNQLADLSSYIGEEISKEGINEAILNTALIQDRILAMTPAVNAMSMLINEEKVSLASSTLDYSTYTFSDFVKTVEEVKKATGQYGWIDVSDNSVLLQYFLRTKGEDIYKYNANGTPEIGFSKGNFLTFMEAIASLAASEALPTAEVVNNLKSFDENPFALGEAGFLQTWTNQYVTYQESAGEEVKISMELPYDTKGTKALYYRPTFYYSVAETSKNKEAAAKFIDFIVNNVEAGKIFGTERGIPANVNVKEAIYPDMSETEKATADYLDAIEDLVGDASPVPPVGYSEINNHFKEVYAEVTYGTMTPEEAYTSFVEKAEEIFDENYN
ncbi:MAG: carbohydrate ABC transporter substrate-binding protein [Enterococcus sp.]|jgi:multiple sugar transport system substrate-binding protein|nr:carbohydrate ABC transporter substrate-binding protein [Enterococcus sp.]